MSWFLVASSLAIITAARSQGVEPLHFPAMELFPLQAACYHRASARFGLCQPLLRCAVALRERSQGGSPQVCGFDGGNLVPIVCCVESEGEGNPHVGAEGTPGPTAPTAGTTTSLGLVSDVSTVRADDTGTTDFSAQQQLLAATGPQEAGSQTNSTPDEGFEASPADVVSEIPVDTLPVNVTIKVDPCGEIGYKCKSGECIGDFVRCDNHQDCKDNSDEGHTGCVGSPLTRVGVGDIVTAKMVATRGTSGLFMMLCNLTSCARVRAYGIPSGALVYHSSTGCDWPGPGWPCAKDDPIPTYWKNTPKGEYTFGLQYRAAEAGAPAALAVWRLATPAALDSGLADELVVGQAEAPVNASFIVVKPSFWDNKFWVHFNRGDISLFPNATSLPKNPLDALLLHTVSSQTQDGIPKDKVCSGGDFRCTDGLCVRAEWRCDGQVHCIDGSDENQAACYKACSSDSDFRCKSGQCVGGLEKCDEIQHCSDGSDETPEACAKDCAVGTFRCASGQCISGIDRCSGLKQCYDGSDETISVCAAPSLDLPVGSVATASLGVRMHHKRVALFVCHGDKDCSNIIAMGGSDGGLRYWLRTNCTWPGWACDTSSPTPSDGFDLIERNYTLVLERRPSQLAVWALEQPGHVGLVDAPEGAFTVRVRPMYWTNEPFQIQFERKVWNNTGESASCGLAPAAPIALTVHGTKVAPGTFPWHAALYLKRGSQRHFICGGSLISNRVVVTAAHCVFSNDELRPPNSFTVALGKTFSSWDHHEASAIFTRGVARVMPLPLYQGSKRNEADDLAALLLETAVPLSNQTMPVCVDQSVVLSDDELIQVVGWGAVGSPLEELEAVSVRHSPFEACVRNLTLNPFEAAGITPDKFCAIRESGRRPAGLAKGDSGGGAVVQRRGLWFLVGVVSTSLDFGNMFSFTDVRSRASWLNQTALRPM